MLTLYQLHAAEYRFQVELNWKRNQYFLALNVAVLVAGGGLLGGSSGPRELLVAAAVFAVGGATAWLARQMIATQHLYYRNTRDRLRGIEADLALGQHGLGTTAGMGGSHAPKSRITKMLGATVTILGVFDVLGVLTALALLCAGVCSAPPVP